MSKGQSEIDYIRCMSKIEDSLDIARELDALLDDMHKRKQQAALSAPERVSAMEPQAADAAQPRERRVVNE